MARLVPIAEEDLTNEQRPIHDALVAGPAGRVAGPYIAWLRSPALAARILPFGAFCRYETSLPPRLSELAILLMAREWSVQLEWKAHYPLAIGAGADPAALEAVRTRTTPEFAKRDEKILYRLFVELTTTKEISDGLYAEALETFGETSLVELIAIFGYYGHVAMTLKTFAMAPADGSTPLDD